MSNNQNEFMAKPIKWNNDLSEITLSTKFMSPDQIQTLIDFINEDKYIKIKVSLIKQLSKSYKQLQKYYADINKILSAIGVEITKDNVQTIDYELKKSVMDCEVKIVDGKPFIIVPSKSNMTVEQMNYLIHKLEETYSFLGIDFSKIENE